VPVKRSSRFLRYPISSTISLTIPSSLRISVSSPERDSWLAMALGSAFQLEEKRDGGVVSHTCSRLHQHQCQHPNRQHARVPGLSHTRCLGVVIQLYDNINGMKNMPPSMWFLKHTPTSPSLCVVMASRASPEIPFLARYTLFFGLESTISTSTRWFGPGTTLAVTMTRVFVCAGFHMHFDWGYRCAGRVNLIACVEGDWRRVMERSRRGSREKIENSCIR